jgi:hypothetical protein
MAIFADINFIIEIFLEEIVVIKKGGTILGLDVFLVLDVALGGEVIANLSLASEVER